MPRRTAAPLPVFRSSASTWSCGQPSAMVRDIASGVVGAAVVDDQHLVGLIAPVEVGAHPRERRGQTLLLVVRGNDDAQHRTLTRPARRAAASRRSSHQ